MRQLKNLGLDSEAGVWVRFGDSVLPPCIVTRVIGYDTPVEPWKNLGTLTNGDQLSRAWAPIAAPSRATKAGAFAPATICSIKCPDQADLAPKAPISPEVSAYGVKSLSLWGQNLTLWCHPHPHLP